MTHLFKKCILSAIYTLPFFGCFEELKAQNFQCGTPPISEQALMQRYQSVGFIPTPGSATVASSIQTTYSIPIKAILITDNGTNPFPDPEFWMHEAIRWMNERFKSQSISFYLCNFQPISDPARYNLTNPGTGLLQLTDLYGDPQALNVFIVNDIVGPDIGIYVTRNGNVNNAVAIDVGTVGSISTLAHEVGHFLGLVHTQENTVTNWNCSGVSYKIPRFTSSSTCTVSFCSCNGQTCSALNSGDMISDTPVDPFEASNCVWENCGQVCNINFQAPCLPLYGQTLTYTPPHDNIMSYYAESCKSKFSPKQLELMKMMLDNGSGYAFLRDQILPVCSNAGAFAANGQVLYMFDSDGTSGSAVETLIPFPGLKVRTDQNGFPCTTTTNATGTYNNCSVSSSGQNYSLGPDLAGETAAWVEPLTGVTTIDLIQIQKYLNLQIGFHNYHLIAADANWDGLIQADDITAIRDVILNIRPNFINTPAWRFVPQAMIFGDSPDTWLIKRNSNQGTSADRTDPFRNDWTNFDGQFRVYCRTCGPNYFARPNFTALYKAASNTKLWSFVGIKTGDLNFSTAISLPPLRSPEISVNYSVVPELRGGEAKLSIKKGDNFSVQVTANPKGKALRILGYQMGLKINPLLAELTGVSPGEVRKFQGDQFALERQEKGVIKTLWMDNEPIRLNGEKTLFEVQLRALENIESLEALIALSSEALAPEFVSDEDEILAPQIGFKVKNEQVSIKSVRIFPNPTQSALSFELDFLNAGDASITLVDQYGNRMEQAFLAQKGKNTIAIEQTSKLLPGVLFYNIQQQGFVLSGQVVKIK
jgi:hypothetical protein